VGVPRIDYACRECGYRHPKWLGRCPECGAWASMTEAGAAPTARTSRSSPAIAPVPFADVAGTDAERATTGLGELDRVLGGGLVPGAVVLVGGEPGIGKSTLALQAAASLAQRGATALYVSAEESVAQLRLRGDRIGAVSRRLLVLGESDTDTAVDAMRSSGASLMVVDSIQAVRCADVDSVPGSVAQVREAASRFVALAKATGVPVFLVGHVTKDGALAGPRALEHAVDTVLQFEGDRHHAHRILRTLKNRYGASDEVGVFTMTDAGLRGVDSPSALFLAERPTLAPGSAVLAAIEGTRALLVEVQALVGEPVQGSPRRTALGVDGGRLALILAVLERRAGFDLATRDVFVNIPGGITVGEPAADLAVAIAAASSVSRRPLPEQVLLIGELGLAGEVRSVSRLETRLREAARMGFRTAVVPEAARAAAAPAGLELRAVGQVGDALALLAPDGATR